MVRNIVVLGGSSHPQLTERICTMLGIPPAQTILSKFAVGETRVEIQDSVRGKDVYVIQSGSGKVNDNIMELLITISACKTASAKKVTAVMPLFPYSRQPDIPYNKIGAPLSKAPSVRNEPYTFESRPVTPGGHDPAQLSPTQLTSGLERELNRVAERGGDTYNPRRNGRASQVPTPLRLSFAEHRGAPGPPSLSGGECNPNNFTYKPSFGYRQWVAQAGTLIASLLTCAGADHIITMDLHDPQYQGFFDIPVDNLYARPLLKRYIQHNIPNYQEAVIVSPDAGGAKRATAIADALSMEFALIHKVDHTSRRLDALGGPSLAGTSRAGPSGHGPGPSRSAEALPTNSTLPNRIMLDQIADPSIQQQERRSNTRSTPGRQHATMMLVGNLKDKVAIIVDDLVDTGNTITRAAKLVKERGGATKVYAIVTHAILSGDAIERINASALDKVVVTNSVPQHEHLRRCHKLEVLDVSSVFAEAIRRVHHGESISVLFQFD